MGKSVRLLKMVSILVLASSFSISFMFVRGLSSSENLLFSDSFENYTVHSFPLQWALVFNGLGNQYQQVINDPLNSSNKCLQLQGQRIWASDAVRYFQSNASIIGFEVSVLVTANTGQAQDDVKVGLWKQIDWGNAVWTYGVTFTDNGTIVAGANVNDDGIGTVLQTYVPGQWYHIRFVLDRSNRAVSVWVDGTLKGENITGSTNPYVFDGFAVSGRYTEIPVNYDNVRIFESSANLPTLYQPSLTVSCIGSTSYSGFNVQINGVLTFNGTGISDSPILLSYSVTGGKSWQDLTLVYTDSDGSYSASWMPTVSGSYLLNAVYEGNDNYSEVNGLVNFALASFNQKSVFSLTSNSTISQFSFNSTSRELSFGVSGESGTTGYAEVNIPQSMLNDISDLKVDLDGNQIQYSYQSQSDSWLLYLTYHHSSHLITINLSSETAPSPFPSYAPLSSPTKQPTTETSQTASPAPKQETNNPNLTLETAGVIVIAIIVVGLLVYFRKRRGGHE